MAQRRFGPTLGAGTVIIEQQAAQLIDPAPLGVTLYACPTAKGDPTKVISTFSKRDMLKKVGGRISGFTGMDCALDFWDNSQGAGELHFLRVAVQADLRKAQVQLWSREATTAPDGYSGTDGKTRPIAQIAAASGGRWGSQRRTIYRTVADSTKIAATALTTQLTMKQDEWKGGYVILNAVPTKQYAITGNSTAGVVSVSSDSNMASDFGVSTDLGYQLVLPTGMNVDGSDADVRILTGDGDNDPINNFSLAIIENDTQVKRYADLSMDPANKLYFVRMINDDQGNYWITATDLLTPSAPTPNDRRPCGEDGAVASITSLTLTQKGYQVRRTAGASNPSVTMSSDTDTMKYKDTLRIAATVSGGNVTLHMTSLRLGGGAVVHADVTGLNTAGTNLVFGAPTCPLTPHFTVTVGSTVFTTGDTFEIDYMPFYPGDLVGGYVVPNLATNPTNRFKITANDHKTITIQSGDLMVQGGGATGSRFCVFHAKPLGGTDLADGTVMNGYDALAALADSDYTTVQLNAGVSPAKALLVQNKGLVKVATPGYNTTAVQQAGLVFADTFNWQYRVEIPSNILDEGAAINYINNTIGRNDYGVTIFPSYVYVADQDKPGQLKLISATGQVHGREALVAKQFQGYHKAAAGVDVTLPSVVMLPTGDTVLNEELLNPQGVNVLKKKGPTFIIWGDRTIAQDPNWKFKHQRELMSHYENRLREGFDFVIFAINDQTLWDQLLTTLRAFFLPEWVKKAVRGDKFEDAVTIKIDSENNTDATEANGDLFCDISLRLADTVERFNINMSKAGIFDGVSA